MNMYIITTSHHSPKLKQMSSPDHPLASQEHVFVLPNVPPNNHTFCLWDVGGRISCGAYVDLADLSRHLRTHGVQGPANLIMACAWGSCERAPMKRESIVRHIEEVHLHVKHSCSQCGASFSRRSTRNAHLSNYHPHMS